MEHFTLDYQKFLHPMGPRKWWRCPQINTANWSTMPVCRMGPQFNTLCDSYCTQLLSEGHNPSIVTSLPGTHRVQEFLITQGDSVVEGHLRQTRWQCFFNLYWSHLYDNVEALPRKLRTGKGVVREYFYYTLSWKKRTISKNYVLETLSQGRWPQVMLSFGKLFSSALPILNLTRGYWLAFQDRILSYMHSFWVYITVPHHRTYLILPLYTTLTYWQCLWLVGRMIFLMRFTVQRSVITLSMITKRSSISWGVFGGKINCFSGTFTASFLNSKTSCWH